MGWTKPSELKAQVQRLWDRGELLRALMSDEPFFPKRLKFTGPTSSEISEQFDSVRSWIAEICSTPNCRIVLRDYKHRVFGKNQLPVEAWIDTADQAFAMIGKKREASKFLEVLNLTNHRQPELLNWLQKRPLQAVDLHGDWERLLSVIEWMQAHKRPAIYLRQEDVSSIHTKYIESHLSVLSELLDLVLPAECIVADATGVNQFARRYGFLSKPTFVRFRVLDPSRQLLAINATQDISLDSASFALLAPNISNVFFTENEVNYLALPGLARSMVIFGSGYGFERLREAVWLRDCNIYYWGDIDTHGLAILASARKYFPQIHSVLMDEDTLLEHRMFWGREPLQSPINDLPLLTFDEQRLYENLKANKWQENVRLEQERIGWNFVLNAIQAINL